jgi:hypothetical protein
MELNESKMLQAILVLTAETLAAKCLLLINEVVENTGV